MADSRFSYAFCENTPSNTQYMVSVPVNSFWESEYDMDISDMELNNVCDDILIKPTVVRLKCRNGVIVQDCDVYIGRRIHQGGWNLPQSDWANPFTIKQCGSAQEAVRLYEKYIRNERPDLVRRIPELYGKTLGCWCKPGPCHGDVLIKLFEEYQSNNESGNRKYPPMRLSSCCGRE